ncbi:GcrA cell cycle regulator [Roseibium denhamense]|uniref:GcrA cell cycle regulator n=1 Tax=Roseibium denhamense TaxID=76305 RepID=A0ABY1P673_9HYPH|nr:GcrA family cell cycle regulator [Roseibium denhamense]MTI07278.1 GcrA cell cycle regulator [Roseibium denhamense]SMP26132.1 GcrA cell cycle regulator [Roseibium denhamense]
MSWTDERVELLKKLWGDGLSASQIAGELGGVTRNAVIGKVHRLGLSGRAKTSAPSTKARRPRVNAAPAAKKPTQQPQTVGATALKQDFVPAPVQEAKPEVEPVAELVPMGQRASILTLTERTCKWPIGDPATDDFYFCGRVSEAGVPYCTYHCKIAYQPVADRRRDRTKAVARAS